MQQKRNQLLDVAKGVAIILVVWGHALQQYSGLENHVVLNLWMERFLISFHMPLFMLVSGYLFYFSLQRHSEQDIVKGRFKMFTLPILTMSILHFLRENLNHFSLRALYDNYPLTLANTLWFFWAMFIVTMFMCLVHKFLRDSIVGYIGILGVTLLLPNMYPLRAYVHLTPMFVVAYLFAKCRMRYSMGQISLVWQVVLLSVLIVLFSIMLGRFGYDDMIYFSRFSLLGSTDVKMDLARDMFRFAIGLVGSLMVLQLLNLAISIRSFSEKIIACLSSIGRMTFGIYVFQDLMLLVLSPITKYLDVSHYLINAIVFFVIIFSVSIFLTRYAKEKKYMSLFFLGQ